jgi:hypothetical protein
MGGLHLLPDGPFLPRPPQGFVTRQRTEVPGAGLYALDAEVRAAGGYIESTVVRANALTGGRWTAPPSEQGAWYVIPADAV